MTKDKRFRERVFPTLFGNRCEEFTYEDSAFNVHKAKESTARVVIWKEYSLVNSFTLECSFFGPTKGPLKDTHFTISTLLDLGRHFCQTLAEYHSLELREEAMRKILKEIEAQQVIPITSLPEEEEQEADDATKTVKIKKSKSKINEIGLIKVLKQPKKSFMNLRNSGKSAMSVATPFSRKISATQASVPLLVTPSKAPRKS